MKELRVQPIGVVGQISVSLLLLSQIGTLSEGLEILIPITAAIYALAGCYKWMKTRDVNSFAENWQIWHINVMAITVILIEITGG